ncbi:hypothetical protein IIY66_00545 [Candidatus Saccharibacteria bacterium]|nr:hypothetical protein [Candidatus Saccharibacteria bacterium]
MSENINVNNESFAEDKISNDTPDTEPVSVAIAGELGKWSEGIDLKTKAPKPFDIDLREYYDESELPAVTFDRTPSEIEEILKTNDEALRHNNAEIDRLNERIIQVSELDADELRELYNDPGTSDSDKSIIACIETLRLPWEESESLKKNEPRLVANIGSAVNNLYGFDIVEARKIIQNNGSNFRILTRKEREEIEPGSLDDIASAALESFVSNPNYDVSRILDYDEYIHGIMLDCYKRKVDKNGAVVETLDLEEFQERVIESMSWAVLDESSAKKDYTGAEFADLQKRAAAMYADYTTGHHFVTDAELGDRKVVVLGQNEYKSIYKVNNKEEREEFWRDFERRVQRNNEEVFKYDMDVARAEMKPWVDKVDLDIVDDINNDKALTYEDKLKKTTAYMQRVFEVDNFDDKGQRQPIDVKWFRLKRTNLEKAIRKILGIHEKDVDLVERYAGAYYDPSEKSIYSLKPRASKGKLSDYDIGTVAHEMWHAKQFEIAGTKFCQRVSEYKLKKRMYQKNISAYVGLERKLWGDNRNSYKMQIMEREAFAVKQGLLRRLERHHNKKLGRIVLDAFGI